MLIMFSHYSLLAINPFCVSFSPPLFRNSRGSNNLLVIDIKSMGKPLFREVSIFLRITGFVVFVHHPELHNKAGVTFPSPEDGNNSSFRNTGPVIEVSSF
jgi:hypothetical protein